LKKQLRKICAVTGSRAEYGLLKSLFRAIADDAALTLQIVVTGMHLSPEFGLTYKEILADGFQIDANVEMLLSGDSNVAVAKSTGLGVISFADAFDRLQPDLLLLPGDRFEIFSAAQAGLIMKIPIAHLFGGDTTEGAFDEAIRHSLTKMAHIHFVTNEESAARVRQLGEDPASVHVVGTPALDQIRSLNLMNREELAADLGFAFRKQNMIVTFHPVTLASQSSDDQFQALLDSLAELDDMGIIFTKPNSDPEGRKLIEILESFAENRNNVAVYGSLGYLRYLSALAVVDVVVGNSSSGLYEAPSFGIPTVNIGDRQKGRLQSTSVINSEPEKCAILNAIEKALATDCSATVNPYGDGHAIPRIVEAIKALDISRGLLAKKFHWTSDMSAD
jgi:UDP-hydrolysing UDP-N-acetyl-D-glucosamine 2-epimerase